MISILGGKWTTHRLMGEETIDKVQEYLGGPLFLANAGASAERLRRLPPGLLGDALAASSDLPAATAQHLAHKYGTAAPSVLRLAESDPSLVLPLVQGEAPIRAQVVYAARNEMAVTIEDVLARRSVCS